MKENNFPITVFHSQLQKTINNIHKVYESNIDAIASNMLSVMAYPLNNSYEVEIKKDWIIRPNLWILNFAPSGSGKSALLKMLTKSINSKQVEVKKDYAKKLITYDRLTESEPKNLTLTLNGYTPEGMAKVLSSSGNNGKALLITSDEISGMFKSFNQYSKGSGEEDFLEYFDYSSKNIARANRENDVFISEKNVSIIGLTQVKKAFEIMTEDRINNGNAFRFLYVIENEIDINKNSFKNLDNTIDYMSDFNDMIQYFLQGIDDYELIRKQLILSDECKYYLPVWIEDVKQKYDIDRGVLMSILGKMDAYLLKFAIVLNRTRVYFEDMETNKQFKFKSSDLNISIEDIKNAALLAEYFISNSIQILNKVSNPTDKYFKTELEKEIFENIPDTFNTSDFINAFKAKGKMSDKTAQRRLKDYQNQNIVGRNKLGEYYKKIA